ncbi:hypothetical protein RhiirA5_402002 [Rhizophagus irregularis]|uniref:Uncharacterized protein n=1 Tax=Rhizophagus irregularis TaxID=588596 RepID=A0A2N0P8Y8_9GLOM|nr:hypothetical protein RhiirA5_402002 [Rhizophagus irregularis]
MNKKTSRQTCRFGFPKELTDQPTIQNDNGRLELTTARIDPLINPHDHIQLQRWRQMLTILSQHAALQYVSKYASKAEPRSLALSEILNQTLRNDNPDDPGDPGIKAFQRLLIHTVEERDYTAQETCHLSTSTATLSL